MGLRNKPLRYAHAEGHTDVCFSEDGLSIVTCGHDGDVRVWAGIEDDEPSSHCVGERALAVRVRDGRLYVATENHAVQAYTYPAFDKDGIVTRFTAPVTHIMTSAKIEVLGCASENMEARICSPEGGAPVCVMSGHAGPVLSVAVCPSARLAATASGDGRLRLWDIDLQKVLKEIECVPKINTFYSAKVLCRADFEPQEGKYLAYPNNKEIVVLDTETMSQRMIFNHSTIKCAMSQCAFSPCGGFLAGSSVAGQLAVWEVATGDCVGVVEHPSSHNITAMAWNPKGNGVLAYCDAAGQLGLLENCYGKPSVPIATDEQNYDDIETGGLDDIVEDLIEHYESDDDNAVSVARLKGELGGGVGRGGEGSREGSVSRAGSDAHRAPPRAPPQPPFQPSATPAHLEHRYMCWNEVGIVRSHAATGGVESSIEVEFHDTSVHHGLHLTNYLHHTMASLSTAALLLACEAPSKLVCISLVGSSKEWSVSLPNTEEALCVCATSALVACATDARLLRLFTPMGTQLQVISLAGPAVALSGFNTNILATYHATDPGPSDQHLAMDIVAVHGQLVRSKTVRVPLTPGARLSWLGASDEGSPCACDTEGVLRLYDIASGVWLPMCDTTAHSKGVSDTWFIVSVSERTQMVRAILCRGATFPPTAPKPTVLQLPIQLPLCEMDTEKSQCEEQLVRWAHIAGPAPDARALRETAIKLFSLACRSEAEQRALELMELLRDPRLLPVAAKYAARVGRAHLAERLGGLADAWRDAAPDEPPAGERVYRELGAQDSCLSGQGDLDVSLILPARTTERVEPTVTPIKPVPMKSLSGRRNPFKKQLEGAKNISSPLSLTERSLVEVNATPDDDRTQENHDPMKPLSGETFADWFARNRSVLERAEPTLAPADLTKHGVRAFRALQAAPPPPRDLTAAPATAERKRKADAEAEVPVVAAATKQSKLSAFAFQKTPQPECT